MENFILIYLIVGSFTNFIWIHKHPSIRFSTLLFMTFINSPILLIMLLSETYFSIKRFYKLIDKKV